MDSCCFCGWPFLFGKRFAFLSKDIEMFCFFGLVKKFLFDNNKHHHHKHINSIFISQIPSAFCQHQKMKVWKMAIGTVLFAYFFLSKSWLRMCVCAFKCATAAPVQQDEFQKGLVEFCVECQTKCHQLAITIRKTKSDQWNFIPTIKISSSTYNSTIARILPRKGRCNLYGDKNKQKIKKKKKNV